MGGCCVPVRDLPVRDCRDRGAWQDCFPPKHEASAAPPWWLASPINMKQTLIISMFLTVLQHHARPQAYELKKKRDAYERILLKYQGSKISQDDIKLAIGSIDDARGHQAQNVGVIKKMIHYLTSFFHPHQEQMGSSLAIDYRGGSRLRHSHKQQYYFVLQVL